MKYVLKLLSYDVEMLIIKEFNTFSSSSNRVTALKECFEFVGSEYAELLKHIPVSWITLYKAVDRLLLNWKAIRMYFLEEEENEFDALIWRFIQDQANELSTDMEPTLPECYFILYITFCSFFNLSY